MKILLLAPEPFFTERGTPLNIQQLVKVLGELGHQIDIVTYHLGENVKIKNTKIYRSWKIPFIKKVAVGPSYVKIFLDFFLFFKAWQRCLKNRYDVIHGVEEGAFLGLFLKKIFHIPLIYDMDSSIPQQLSYTKFLQNKFLLNLVGLLEKWTVTNSILVLTVCVNLTQVITKKYPGKKIVQIEDVPLPLSSKKMSLTELNRFKENLGIKNETIILYTGNLENYQGIELFIKSISIIKEENSLENLKFVLVGGEKEQIQKMKDLSHSLNVNDAIIFTGKKPMEEMQIFMEIADILVSPRLRGTNTPLKLFTYLQSGKPVVATNLSTHTQVLTEEIAMLTEPHPKSFAYGILHLVKNKELRKKLGKRGKELVEKKYSYAVFFKKVSGMYNNISRTLL